MISYVLYSLHIPSSSPITFQSFNKVEDFYYILQLYYKTGCHISAFVSAHSNLRATLSANMLNKMTLTFHRTAYIVALRMRWIIKSYTIRIWYMTKVAYSRWRVDVGANLEKTICGGEGLMLKILTPMVLRGNKDCSNVTEDGVGNFSLGSSRQLWNRIQSEA